MERRGRFIQTFFVPNMTTAKDFSFEQKITENTKKTIKESNERVELDRVLRDESNTKNY
ncbi:MAG: hypothetical protein ACXAEL_01430 [Candidatus Hodarchaeales archaeon]